MTDTKLVKLWESEKYTSSAHNGSMSDHPGMKLIIAEAKKSNMILDLGCGEGTRLGLVSRATPRSKCSGVDISRTAILKAKKSFPSCNFIEGNLVSLPFSDESFDLIYSAFVLEHLDETQLVLKEAVRVLKTKGKLVLVAPNYGAPNRASPVFNGNRLAKLVRGILMDIFGTGSSLSWTIVHPVTDQKHYQSDSDTVVEPYLGSLVSYLESINIRVRITDSCWNLELPMAKMHQRVFRILATLKIYPFKYWGPHIVLMGEKQ